MRVNFIQPHGVVDIAYSLTWHEADELIRITANVGRIIDEPRSLVKISSKDGFIFINSPQQRKSFVVQHSDRLWENLYCRLAKQAIDETLVELTESEFNELYARKLQEF